MPITEIEIINKIKKTPNLLEQLSCPIPLPYFSNKDNTKAIVLGADPSNFSGPNNTTIQLKTVFDLPACAPPAFNFVRAGKASAGRSAASAR